MHSPVASPARDRQAIQRVTDAVEVNGRTYRLPTRPTVVITVDGGDPAYFDDALRARADAVSDGDAGRWRHVRAGPRAHAVADQSQQPVDRDRRAAQPPRHLGQPRTSARTAARSSSPTRASFARPPSTPRCTPAGARVLTVTAKDKLRRLLGAGDVPVDQRRARRPSTACRPSGSTTCAPGRRPQPGIYDWELSAYALEIGLARASRGRAGLLYVSLTDYVQHKQAPGGELTRLLFPPPRRAARRVPARGIRDRHHRRSRHERQAARPTSSRTSGH